MSDTPPLSREASNHSARSTHYTGFGYPPHVPLIGGSVSEMEYSGGIMGADRKSGSAYTRQQMDDYNDPQRGNISRQESWIPGKEEGRRMCVGRDDDASYRMLAEEINNRNMSGIKNLLNQGLDINYKMRDGHTPYSIASGTGDKDVLRCVQKYSIDQIGRNFTAKSSDSQLPTYPDPSYLSQSRAPSLQHSRDHSISSALMNKQMAPSRPIPVMDMLFPYEYPAHRMSPYPRQTQERHSGLPYSFDPKMYAHDTNMGAFKNYSMPNQIGAGQSGSIVHPSAPNHADVDMSSKTLYNLLPFPYQDSSRNYKTLYSPLNSTVKYDKRAIESELLSSTRHMRVDPAGMEKNTYFPNNYPMYNSTSNYSGARATPPMLLNMSNRPSPPISQKKSETSVIDLTNCNSPDTPIMNSSTLLKESASNSRSVPPPLVPGYGPQHKERSKLLQTQSDARAPLWDQGNAYCNKSIPTTYPMGTNYPSVSIPPYVNSDLHRSLTMSFAPTFGFQQPNYHLALNEQPAFNSYEGLLSDHSHGHLTKGVSDSGLPKLGQQWPQRYLTPSPHTCITHDPRKKNESPLGVKSKTLPQPTSDLAFNYPEGNKSELSQSSLKYPMNSHESAMLKELGPYPGNKLQHWAHKDDSKLSPFENHILDSAARGCKSHRKTRKNFETFMNLKKTKQTDHTVLPKEDFPTPHLPMNIASSHKEQTAPISNGGIELQRNSVIKSAPKQTDDPRMLGNANSPYQPQLNTNGVQQLPDAKADENVAAEGTIEKMNNVNQNALEKHIGDEIHVVGDASGLADHTSLNPLKRKLSSSTEKKKVKRKKSYTNESLIQKDDNNKEESRKDPTIAGKIQRRPRKSGDMEEYYYDWFYDDETENDDSSDEDYSCPTLPSKVKTTKGGTKLRTRRMSCMGGSDFTSDNDKESTTHDSDSTFKLNDKLIVGKKGKIKHKKEGKNENKVRKKRKVRKEKSRSTEEPTAENASEINEENKEIPEDKAIEVCDEHAIEKSDNDKLKSEEIINNEKQITDICKQRSPHHKKRKYTKSKDKDGIKKKKTKNLDIGKSPKKKRKYKKSMEFITKNEDSDMKEDEKEDESSSKVTGKIHPNISPALVELYTNKQTEVKSNKEKKSKSPQSKLEEKSPSTKKSPKRKYSKDTTKTNNNCSSVPSTVLSNSSTEAATSSKNLKTENEKCSKATSDSKNESATCKYKNELSGAVNNSVPIKIRKKPGPKPGMKKLSVASGADAQGKVDGKEIIKKIKKSKKPKGDGLPRFGMRKRGWSKNKHKKAKAKALKMGNNAANGASTREETLLTKESTKRGLSFQLSDSEKKTPKKIVKIKRLFKKNCPGGDCEDLDGNQGVKKMKNQLKLPEYPRMQDVNKISEELQSQEYDYNFNSEITLSNNDEDQPCTSAPSYIQIKQEHISESPSSPFPSQSQPTAACLETPLPPNFKKLWCNSAIGETQLHKAATNGYIDNLLYYLERGTNVNQADNAGYTALHEACVHNHIEAAMLLLQYGADVNKNAVDGTRPLHDSVEYDHIEMARLMLSCGADPLLSKFSGRAIPNMIHSQRMGAFIQAYLKQLKDSTEEVCENKELEWKLPCSIIFDKPILHGFNVLDDPPDTVSKEETFEFELFENPPAPSYLLQPDEETERGNFYLLDDYLKATTKQNSGNNKNIRIHTMSRERFQKEVWENQIQRAMLNRDRNSTETTIELVALDKAISQADGGEIVCISVHHSTRSSDKDNIFSSIDSHRVESGNGTMCVKDIRKSIPEDGHQNIEQEQEKSNSTLCDVNNHSNISSEDKTEQDCSGVNEAPNNEDCDSLIKENNSVVSEMSKTNDVKSQNELNTNNCDQIEDNCLSSELTVESLKCPEIESKYKSESNIGKLSAFVNGAPVISCLNDGITQNGHDHNLEKCAAIGIEVCPENQLISET